jgi:DNA-binding MarR family transcriptional regulator
VQVVARYNKQAGERADPPQSVADIADTFVALMRTANRAKARFMAAAQHDVDWSAQVILRIIAGNGPMRASALAECLQSDPSTVSRQVATMVKEGLLERRADPEDGRASTLVLTDRAGDVLAAHARTRAQAFAAMLDDWDDEELSTFAAQLGRFTEAFEKMSTQMATEQAAKAPHGSVEGNR